MTKSIHTLVPDIYAVIEGNGGWDETISRHCAEGMQDIFNGRLATERTSREPTLRLSALGSPCRRKLWYGINEPDGGEDLPPSTLLKFLYGDLLEQLLISLAIAAGHDVQGLQSTLEVGGIKGHRDCVIDGITVDVKSASSYSFNKFKEGNLRSDDPFGYVSQLSSYVYAGRSDEVESHPSLGAFLVIDKTLGHLCLDMYDFGPELDRKEAEVEKIKEQMAQPTPPDRAFDPVPDGKSGNMKLSTVCSYCSFKEKCYPGMRTFLYSTGPRYLTNVAKLPNVTEVT